MPEYTFQITDYIKVQTEVILEAAYFHEALAMAEELANGEMSTHERLEELSVRDLVNNIVDTQLHTCS